MSKTIPSPTSSETVGLILAGGMGSRLGGVRKHDLIVGGQTLLDFVAHRLSAICAHTFICAPAPILHTDLISLKDDGRGPAEALVQSVDAICDHIPAAKYVLVTPVDCWRLPQAAGPTLLSALENSENAVAFGSWAQKDYPINCAIRLSSFASTVDFEPASPKGRSVWSIFDKLTSCKVDFTISDSQNPFSNINTINDLCQAQSYRQGDRLAEN